MSWTIVALCGAARMDEIEPAARAVRGVCAVSVVTYHVSVGWDSPLLPHGSFAWEYRCGCGAKSGCVTGRNVMNSMTQ